MRYGRVFVQIYETSIMDNDKKSPDETKEKNENGQPVDKAPGEERGKGEQVTNDDLKGKAVDRDITDPKQEPLS